MRLKGLKRYRGSVCMGGLTGSVLAVLTASGGVESRPGGRARVGVGGVGSHFCSLGGKDGFGFGVGVSRDRLLI